MTSELFTIGGMSCGHCVATVTEELKSLPGVHKVTVDLVSGQACVSSESRIDPSDVRRAIVEAGFELVTAEA